MTCCRDGGKPGERGARGTDSECDFDFICIRTVHFGDGGAGVVFMILDLFAVEAVVVVVVYVFIFLSLLFCPLPFSLPLIGVVSVSKYMCCAIELMVKEHSNFKQHASI